MATSAQAKRVSIAAVGIAGVFAAAGDLAERDLPRVRILIGGAVVLALLTMLAEFQPDLALMFAVVAMLSVFLTTGKTLWERIGNLFGR